MDREMTHEDILRLNALVDGELAPAERAAMAGSLARHRDLAHAHATLARLKAAVGELVEAETDITPRPLPRRGWQFAAAIAGGGLIAAVAAWSILAPSPPDNLASASAPMATEISFASLPAGMTIPRLDSAGLKLTAVSFDARSRPPLVSATFRGPHGCRLDLRAFHPGTELAPVPGATSHYQWEVDSIGYDLTAFGMPEWRFAVVAEAAEWQTRHAPAPAGSELRLREARLTAPPCNGAG